MTTADDQPIEPAAEPAATIGLDRAADILAAPDQDATDEHVAMCIEALNAVADSPEAAHAPLCDLLRVWRLHGHNAASVAPAATACRAAGVSNATIGLLVVVCPHQSGPHQSGPTEAEYAALLAPAGALLSEEPGEEGPARLPGSA